MGGVEVKKFKVKRLIGEVKKYILTKREKALSVYGNLRRSGRHIVWVSTKR